MNLRYIFLSIFLPIVLASVLLLAVDVEVGYGQQVIKTVDYRPPGLTGNGVWPNQMALDRGLNKLFVAHANGDCISIIDGDDGSIASVPFGGWPTDIAVNQSTHRVYVINRIPVVGNRRGYQLTVIDGDTNSIVTTIYIGGYILSPKGLHLSRQLAVNEATNKIYVTDYLEDRIMVVDGVDYSTHDIAVGPSPTLIAVNENTNKLYVVDETRDTLMVIDGTTETIITELNLPFRGFTYLNLTVNERNNLIYLTERTNKALIVVTGYDNTILRTVNLTAGLGGGRSLAVNKTNGKVYVRLGNGSLDVIRGKKRTNIPTSLGRSILGVTIDESRNLVYLTQFRDDEARGAVTVFDGSTDTELKTIDIGDHPTMIEVNEDTNQVFACLEDECSISIINRNFGDMVTTTKMGVWIQDVDVNPSLSRAYLTGTDSDQLLVYDYASDQKRTPIAVGSYPYVVKVNEGNNKVYVSCGNDETIWIIEDTAGSIRGSPDERRISVISDPRIVLNPDSPKLRRIVERAGTPAAQQFLTKLEERPYRRPHRPEPGAVIDDPLVLVPGEIAINKTTDKVYVVTIFGIVVINPDDTWSFITTLDFSTLFFYPTYLDVDEVRNRVYIYGFDAYTATGYVGVIDGASDSIITLDDIPVQGYANSIEVNETTNEVYTCSTRFRNILTYIDGVSFSTGEINLGWDAQIYSMTVSEETNTVYLSDWYWTDPEKINKDTIMAVDGATKTVLPGRIGQISRTMTASDQFPCVYGADYTNTFFIIDEPSFSSTEVAVGHIAVSLSVDETINRALVANLGSGTMSIVDTLAKSDIAVGQGPDSSSYVRDFNFNGTLKGTFQAFGLGNPNGEVSVAKGDVTGDGIAEIVVGQRSIGASSYVRVSSEDGTPLWTFRAFGGGNPNGMVNVGVGDVDKDGVNEIICGQGPGGDSWVRVFEFANPTAVWTFKAFGPANTNGEVRVTGGETSGSSVGQVIAGTGHDGGSYVRIFDFGSSTPVSTFKAFGAGNASGGVDVGACDVDGDGLDELIVGQGGPGAGQPAAQSYFRVFEADGIKLWTIKAFGPENAEGHITVSGDYLGYIIVGEGPSSSSKSWVRVYRFLESTPVVAFKAFGGGNGQGGVDVAGEK